MRCFERQMLRAMKLFHQTLAKNAKAILAEGFKAAQLMDLRIHDHVIIGSGSHAWVSLANGGPI